MLSAEINEPTWNKADRDRYELNHRIGAAKAANAPDHLSFQIQVKVPKNVLEMRVFVELFEDERLIGRRLIQFTPNRKRFAMESMHLKDQIPISYVAQKQQLPIAYHLDILNVKYMEKKGWISKNQVRGIMDVQMDECVCFDWNIPRDLLDEFVNSPPDKAYYSPQFGVDGNWGMLCIPKSAVATHGGIVLLLSLLRMPNKIKSLRAFTVVTTSHKSKLSDCTRPDHEFHPEQGYRSALIRRNQWKLEDVNDITELTITIKVRILRVCDDDGNEIEEIK